MSIFRHLRLLFKITSRRKYYVNFETGDDSNDGLSKNSQWKTITKINNFPDFQFNDIISFERGQVWEGVCLNIPRDGLSFESHGSGPFPIVDGMNTVDCVNANGKNNIKLKNIAFRNGWDFGIAVAHVYGWTIKNCKAYSCGNDNLIFSDAYFCQVIGGSYYNAYVRAQDTRHISGIEIKDGAHDIIIKGAELYGNTGLASPAHYGSAIAIHNHLGTNVYPYNIIIEDCYIHDEGINCFGIRVRNSDNIPMGNQNIIIRNNHIIANTLDGIQVISGNISYPVNDISIYGNSIFLNLRGGISLSYVTNISIYRNIITNNNNSQLGQQFVITDCKNVTIFNNTTYSYYDATWYPIFIQGPTCENIKIKNNIIGGTIANLTNIQTIAGTGKNGFECDYNLYQYTGTGNRWKDLGVAKSFTTWTALGYDTHSPVRGDPLFVNVSQNDFSLQNGSPAINAGVDVGLLYLGVAPDCGAIEKQ